MIFDFELFCYTLNPIYSELGYSEYPVIVNGFSCTNPFTITEMKCINYYSRITSLY